MLLIAMGDLLDISNPWVEKYFDKLVTSGLDSYSKDRAGIDWSQRYRIRSCEVNFYIPILT